MARRVKDHIRAIGIAVQGAAAAVTGPGVRVLGRKGRETHDDVAVAVTLSVHGALRRHRRPAVGGMGRACNRLLWEVIIAGYMGTNIDD